QGAARQAAHARPVGAAERRAGGQDRLPDPGRGRGRPAGHPGQHLLPRPGDRGGEEEGRRGRQEEGRRRWGRRWRRGGGGGGGGGGAGGEIRVPAIGKQDTKTYAKAAADIGIVPVTKNVFSDKPVGTLFGTEPPGGTLVKPKSKVTLLVSSGQPDVVFSNGK